MANNRKVQAEIDRLLKKTQEGLESYEELYDKFESAANPSNKERLEGDLKREIKKLQRQREQIKGFVASPEVKDTKLLETYRKKIEEKMEAFKACEREMKTKAFSKEGLASAGNERDGPGAQTEAWLKTCIEDCRKKIEIAEYEAQKSSGRNRKGNNKKSDAQQRLEMLQIHLYRWETLMRMVVNEELDPNEVDDLHDRVDEVLDEDATLETICDMSMYEMFDIPEPKVKSQVEEEAPKSAPALAPAGAAAAKQVPPKKTSPVTVAKAPNTPATNIESQPASFSKSSTPISPSIAVTTQSRAAPAPSPAKPLATTLARASLGDEEEEDIPEWMMDDGAIDDTFGDDAMGGAAAGSLAEMASATSKMTSEWEKRKLDIKKTAPAEEQAASKKTLTPPSGVSSPSNASKPTTNDWEKRKLDLKGTAATTAAAAKPTAAEIPKPLAQQTTTAAAPAPAATATATATIQVALPQAPQAEQPHSKSTLASPPPRASAGAGTKYDATTMFSLLDVSLGNLPHTLDVERQRPYEPPNAIDPIPFFPQEVHPVLSSKDIYHKFDLETLFFIFYYHQKSHQQYFASKELKAHSFRYHTELRRWYQRREKPKETTQFSERGAYTFFDYEDSWQKKDIDDFVFEYKFLEDDLS